MLTVATPQGLHSFYVACGTNLKWKCFDVSVCWCQARGLRAGARAGLANMSIINVTVWSLCLLSHRSKSVYSKSLDIPDARIKCSKEERY